MAVTLRTFSSRFIIVVLVGVYATNLWYFLYCTKQAGAFLSCSCFLW
ncbi:hypothetical protein HMPREF9446_02732 [Bacteroides fluxus YIT 12057]|uniref:Uncharacterized protein n=1 Tax=Bacteroides fluxus YIT 12057 TaxID=763034 RepID=F3PVF4_9BACE|nr:hypothetical protein HMPREF9446_02732 [Bacteroides fluxus YIT 12057]